VPKLWTFRDFVDSQGKNVIRAWLGEQRPKAKARINTVIAHLEQSSKDQWGGYVKDLTGRRWRGLLEIRVTCNNVQYRPLACYGPGRREVTILFGAIERGDRFEPRSAPQTALENMGLIGQEGRTVEHDFS